MPLTDFQIQCENNLSEALGKRGVALVNRHTDGKNETYITAEIPSAHIKVWIYENEAELTAGDKSYIFEAPDYPDEKVLVSKFIDAVVSILESRAPSDAGSKWFALFKGKKL